MTMYLDPLDDDVTKAIGAITAEPPLRLKDLHPENPDVKTYAISPGTIAGIPTGSVDRLPEFTLPPSGSSKVAEAVHAAGILDLPTTSLKFSPEAAWEKIETGIRNDPNIAAEAVKAGLAREKLGSDKLQKHSREIKQHLKNIDTLLDLSAELTAVGEKDLDIPSKMQKMIDELRESGIEVWASGGTKISKDKLGEMKSLISSQIDKARTSIQTTITVEIQPEINNLNAIMNAIQQMIQATARLIKHANDNSTK